MISSARLLGLLIVTVSIKCTTECSFRRPENGVYKTKIESIHGCTRVVATFLCRNDDYGLSGPKKLVCFAYHDKSVYNQPIYPRCVRRLILSRSLFETKRCNSMYDAIARVSPRVGSCSIYDKCRAVECEGVVSTKPEYKGQTTWTVITFNPCTKPKSFHLQVSVIPRIKRKHLSTWKYEWKPKKEVINKHIIQTITLDHGEVGYTYVEMETVGHELRLKISQYLGLYDTDREEIELLPSSNLFMFCDDPLPTAPPLVPLTYPTFTLPDLKIPTLPVLQLQRLNDTRDVGFQSADNNLNDTVVGNINTTGEVGLLSQTENTLQDENATAISSAKHSYKAESFLCVQMLSFHGILLSGTI